MDRIFSDDMAMLKKMKCPFIYEPHEDCYCADMNSQNIEKALHFCGENFTVCGIYKMLSGETKC